MNISLRKANRSASRQRAAMRAPATIAIVSILLFAGCAGGDEAANDSGLRSLTINYPTTSGATWPMFVAKEGGYYEKYGLDVDLVFGVHPAGVAMLTSGEAEMANYSLEQSLLASSLDGSLVMVGSSLNRGLFALMSSPEINSVADLRNRRLGISQIGDAPYNYTVALLAKFGLTDRDVQWIPAGAGVGGRAAALVGGRVDATLLTAPAFFTLEEQGFTKLADFSEYDDIYASTVYLMSRETLESDPDLAEMLIRAHAEAIARFYEDKDLAVQAYLAYDPAQAAEDVARNYDRYADSNALERIPYVLEGAVRSVIEQANTEDSPQMLGFDFSRVIDNSIIDRLIAEGFFVDLFGPEIVEEQERKAALAFR